MRKNDLQRDKAFRQRLAQKLEVEQPPESYFQAVQSAFASLPDELPVKARPIHQRVLRTCAALAACCARSAARRCRCCSSAALFGAAALGCSENLS